jgi:hypothetical protein
MDPDHTSGQPETTEITFFKTLKGYGTNHIKYKAIKQRCIVLSKIGECKNTDSVSAEKE